MSAAIYACCILHNFCLDSRDDFNEDIYREQVSSDTFTPDPFGEQDFQTSNEQTSRELRRCGQQRRQQLVDYIWRLHTQ